MPMEDTWLQSGKGLQCSANVKVMSVEEAVLGISIWRPGFDKYPHALPGDIPMFSEGLMQNCSYLEVLIPKP